MEIGKSEKIQCLQGVPGFVDNVEIVDGHNNHSIFRHKIQEKCQLWVPCCLAGISTYFGGGYLQKYVDNVENYAFRRFSPMFTTSPAPIVINKSPGEQFSKRNFSISPKEGK